MKAGHIRDCPPFVDTACISSHQSLLSWSPQMKTTPGFCTQFLILKKKMPSEMEVALAHKTIKSSYDGLGRMDGSYPLGCYDYESTCCANKWLQELEFTMQKYFSCISMRIHQPIEWNFTLLQLPLSHPSTHIALQPSNHLTINLPQSSEYLMLFRPKLPFPP